MFFKRRKKEKENKTTKKIIENPSIKKKLPIITLDNSWHKLISEIKTPEIESLEKELNNLLKEQGKLNTDFIEYTNIKKDTLDEILNLTHEAFELNSEKAKSKIDKKQQMVFKINEKLEKIEEQLDIVPKEIEKINTQLVDESVNRCYKYINIYQHESQKLDSEIEVIRETLMEKTEKKKAYDEKASNLYRYLHHLLGPGFIEKLDDIYWENEE